MFLSLTGILRGKAFLLTWLLFLSTIYKKENKKLFTKPINLAKPTIFEKVVLNS